MMKHGKSNIGIRRSQKGFALVVILAFMVLLTVLVLAYFSYSSLQRQISSANSNQATADIFAQGAINTIISDFKQEIANGSTNTTYGTNTVSIPLAATNAVPSRVGTSTNLPNLIKRSASGLAFSPGGATRAATVSSTAASQNGRSISPARWNAALLLPKSNTNSTDLTPANFTAPDWIYVNRGGGNPTTWNADMRWSSAAASTNTVIGRYAYTIYDEGGLLDVNVAGYPPGTTQSLSGHKSPLSYADLTQVGLNTNTISALVGWRNAASSQPGGTFPNHTFNAAAQTNFYKSVTSNASGFLRAANTNLIGGESDRLFISRQQLIQFFATLADAGLQTKESLQNALQYLSTFSRAIEQPTFAPHPSRPRIIGSSAPPAAAFVDSYRGNNDAWGGDDLINPSFLSVRVMAPFTRWDGTEAVAGEPLVKKRFSLKRLAYLTMEGPSSSASAATKTRLLNAGIPQSVIDDGTPANILKCFGLVWDNGDKTWTYDHGSAAIMTLSQVAAANREPDFFELLKASISAGSLAKAGPNLHNPQDNYQYALDVALDYQVLQIAANLIDQFDADSFPTSIQISSGSLPAYMRVFRGIEDLPYFYRYHRFVVVTEQPDPLLSKIESVTFPAGTSTQPSGVTASDYVFRGARAATLVEPGSASLFYVASVWNPHDASGPTVATGPRPTRFRVQAVTQDPVAQTGPWEIGSKSLLQNHNSVAGQAIVPATMYPSSDPETAPLAGSLEFSDVSGSLYREPTLLWRPAYPAGANLTGNATATDVHTSQTFTGILVAETPISMGMTIDGTDYVFQGLGRQTVEKTTGAKKQITFRVQFWDGSSWVTYDEKYPDLHVPGEPRMIVNTADMDHAWETSEQHWRNPLKLDVFEKTATSYDPRTARFGVGTANEIGAGSPNGGTLEVNTSVGGSNTAAKNLAIQNSNFTVMETQRPRADRGSKVFYSNPGMTSDPGKNLQMRFFSGVGFSASADGPGIPQTPNQFDGLWAQNDPSIRTLARNDSTQAQFYYQDADGVARRAMGAYANTTLTTGASTVGMPLATANTYGASNGVGSPTSQNQSRPVILNRPFRSVGEMSYAFKGALWKQIDFFTPESGDVALLDTFCVEEPPDDGVVAGKVNLNTRQVPVLKAILAGAYREELANHTSALPTGTTTTPLSPVEAENIATTLVGITSDSTNAWRGPLTNIAEIVGKYVPNPGNPGVQNDLYSYEEPVSGDTYSFSGLSAALNSTVYTEARGPVIQRLREAGIRPLAAVGQVRVWNVMIDMVAQVGRFSPSANALDQFSVEGEKRQWVHLSIDRLTGKVIDYQVELVNE